MWQKELSFSLQSFQCVFRESGGSISPPLCLQWWAPVRLHTHTHTHTQSSEGGVCVFSPWGRRLGRWMRKDILEGTSWRVRNTKHTLTNTHTHTLLCLVRQGFDPKGAVCVCVTDVLSVSLQNVLIYNVSMTKESVSHTTQAERTNNRQKTSVQKSPTSDILCCSRCQTLSLTALQLSGRSWVSFQLFNLH